jgi:uncharacterized protein (DUF2147 family)
MRKLLLTMIAALAASVGVAAADPTGTWLTQGGDSKVRIAPCGGGFCGTIVWLNEDRKDSNNPNASLRDRSLVGVQLFSNMQGSGDSYSGKLYNPRDGKTYTGKLKTLGADKLQLSGCVLGGLICKSETWTKSS